MAELKPKTFAKSIVDGVLKYTSASAIELYERCPTRYWHRYGEGFVEKETPDQRAGIDMHERLELAVRDGKSLPRDEQALLSYLPPVPSEDVVAEHEFELPTESGVVVRGKIDVVNATGEYRESGDADPRESPVEVVDWKRSNPRYRKRGADLLTAAMVTYGKIAMTAFGSATVRLSHVTKDKRSAQSFKESTVATAEQVEAVFKLRVVDGIARIQEGLTDVPNLAKVRSSCFAFGQPCPHLDSCWSPTERLLMSPK